jgi:hypothetical protein
MADSHDSGLARHGYAARGTDEPPSDRSDAESVKRHGAGGRPGVNDYARQRHGPVSSHQPVVARGTEPAVAPTPAASGPAAQTSPPGAAAGTITGYSACVTSTTAYFTATFTVEFNWHHVFINSDGNTRTGYLDPDGPGGLGADYMVENHAPYRSTGSDWSWTPVSSVDPLLSTSGGTYRWQVPLSALGSPARPLSAVFNGSGAHPDAFTPALTPGAC